MMAQATASILPFEKKPGIGFLQSLTEQNLLRVNARILELAKSHVELIPTISEYLVNSGGKRLRPMLTLAAARICGYTGDHHIDLAASVEFIHTATLLHDDVVDESALRRGLATANHIWGNKASVLVGDYLFAQAFHLMVGTGSLEVLRILSTASRVIAEGEVLQLSCSHDAAITEDAYDRVIRAKTAELFAAACEVGAVIADTPHYQLALRRYGEMLGIAFQIVDDTLDYAADTKILGKTVGDDFREGKVTLPVILAYAGGTDKERDYLTTLFQPEGVRDPQAFSRLQEMLTRYDTINAALARARELAIQAQQQLASLPACPEREALDATAQFCIERTY